MWMPGIILWVSDAGLFSPCFSLAKRMGFVYVLISFAERWPSLAEGARLESVCTLTGYRRFESSPLRHFFLLFLFPSQTQSEAGRQECCQPRQAREGAAVTVPPGCPASLTGASLETSLFVYGSAFLDCMTRHHIVPRFLSVPLLFIRSVQAISLTA